MPEFRGIETGYGKREIPRGIDMKVDAQDIVALLGGSHKDIYAFLLLIFVLMVRPDGADGPSGEGQGLTTANSRTGRTL